jgi:hypothetical protein
MPDNNLADASVLTSAFYNTNIREQVIVTCTAATRPSHVEGRRIFETDSNKEYISDGSTWRLAGGSGWTSFTPSWSNLTVGNATQSGEYRYADGGMWVKVQLTFGSTTSMTGNVTMTVPNSETARAGAIGAGTAIYQDTGTRVFIGAARIPGSATTISFFHTESGNTGQVNATNPMTWVTTDILEFLLFVPL